MMLEMNPKNCKIELPMTLLTVQTVPSRRLLLKIVVDAGAFLHSDLQIQPDRPPKICFCENFLPLIHGFNATGGKSQILFCGLIRNKHSR